MKLQRPNNSPRSNNSGEEKLLIIAYHHRKKQIFMVHCWGTYESLIFICNKCQVSEIYIKPPLTLLMKSFLVSIINIIQIGSSQSCQDPVVCFVLFC